MIHNNHKYNRKEIDKLTLGNIKKFLQVQYEFLFSFINVNLENRKT